MLTCITAITSSTISTIIKPKDDNISFVCDNILNIKEHQGFCYVTQAPECCG